MVFNTVNLIIGRRGSGKTVYVKGDKSLKLEGLFQVYLQKKMKVLIIDTFPHPTYSDVPFIEPNKFLLWKKGIYRCYVNINEMEQLLEYVAENIWNTAVFFEDAYKYQYSKLSQSVKRLIGDSKQKNVDLFFMYHNWALVPKDLYRYLDYIEIFKTKDSPEVRKGDMPGCYELVMQAWTSVMNDNNQFAHKTVDCG